MIKTETIIKPIERFTYSSELVAIKLSRDLCLELWERFPISKEDSSYWELISCMIAHCPCCEYYTIRVMGKYADCLEDCPLYGTGLCYTHYCLWGKYIYNSKGCPIKARNSVFKVFKILNRSWLELLRKEEQQMIAPVNNLKMTSPFGDRILNGEEEFHKGIDFISTTGDNRVFSIGQGVVGLDFDDYVDAKRWINKKHSAGNYIIVKTRIGNQGYYVRYLHLAVNYVEKNQVVEEGALIGEYGDVGYSFGAHLHMELYTLDWQLIDPTPILHNILGQVKKEQQ